MDKIEKTRGSFRCSLAMNPARLLAHGRIHLDAFLARFRHDEVR